MDFFEQLGKKLTDAGQNVAQQTKNIADLARLNREISDKEQAIAQLYTAIGRAYYDRHKDDCAAEELQMISEVSALYEEISQRQEAIKKIKGITKCPACGAGVSVESAFCSVCGKQMPLAHSYGETPKTKNCPNCHADVDGSNAFCIFCGTKLD